VLLVRALRGYSDGCASLVLPFYLISLGLNPFQVGLIATATMLGSGIVSIGAGLNEGRRGTRVLLLIAALLMSITGLGFFSLSDFWPLLIIAFFSTINPSNGDISLFLPLEHATIAGTTDTPGRASAFARYSLTGALSTALGALSAGLPQWWAAYYGMGMPDALKLVFFFYAGVGLLVFLIYRELPRRAAPPPQNNAPVLESRGVIMRLTAVFALDSFSSGFVVQSLMALWLFQKFEMPIATAGAVFFWSGLLSACSYPAAVYLYKRIGAVRTMVYSSIPSPLIMIMLPLVHSLEAVIVLLMLRALFASMDQPVRAAFIMNVVPENERAAAASITTVPKSLAAGISPSLSGWMLSVSSFGWPWIASGLIKLVYISLFFRLFRNMEAEQLPKTAQSDAQTQRKS